MRPGAFGASVAKEGGAIGAGAHLTHPKHLSHQTHPKKMVPVQDLNPGQRGYEPRALTKLSYTGE